MQAYLKMEALSDHKSFACLVTGAPPRKRGSITACWTGGDPRTIVDRSAQRRAHATGRRVAIARIKPEVSMVNTRATAAGGPRFLERSSDFASGTALDSSCRLSISHPARQTKKIRGNCKCSEASEAIGRAKLGRNNDRHCRSRSVSGQDQCERGCRETSRHRREAAPPAEISQVRSEHEGAGKCRPESSTPLSNARSRQGVRISKITASSLVSSLLALSLF